MHHERSIEPVSWFLCRACATRWQVPEWDESHLYVSCPACGYKAKIKTVDEGASLPGVIEQTYALLGELKSALRCFTSTAERLTETIRGDNGNKEVS